MLFFEISRKRALHHTVISLAFFSLPHLCPSMINWGKKLFQLISLLERIPSHFEFSFCMSEITKKNEKFEMTSFWTLSKARGLWGAEIASKSVIMQLTLAGHFRAESSNQIFWKKQLVHTTKSYKSSLRSSLSFRFPVTPRTKATEQIWVWCSSKIHPFSRFQKWRMTDIMFFLALHSRFFRKKSLKPSRGFCSWCCENGGIQA